CRPAAAERTVDRPRRRPGIDELPRPAQAELRAKRAEADIDHPEKRKVSLLRRLAAVGLGRRDDQEEPERIAPSVRPVRPPMPAPAPRPADRPIDRPIDRAPPPPRPPMPAAAMPRSPPPLSQYPHPPPP